MPDEKPADPSAEKPDESTDATPEASTEASPAAAAKPAAKTSTSRSSTAKTSTSKKSGGTSGNPAKAGKTGTAEKPRRLRREPDELKYVDGDPMTARAWRSPRFLIGMLFLLGGIAWTAYYYVAVRPEAGAEPGGPAFMADLERWNYLIGFGLLMLGLIVMAHKSTPLGRGRGVVVGMLACFGIGLLWICTFYVITDDISVMPVMNDLGQFNLVVGIAFMAVGFTFATKWE